MFSLLFQGGFAPPRQARFREAHRTLDTNSPEETQASMSSALTLEASPSAGQGNLPLRSLPRWSHTLPSPTSSTFTDLLSAEQKQ